MNVHSWVENEAVDLYPDPVYDGWTRTKPHVAELVENGETAEYAFLKRIQPSSDSRKKCELPYTSGGGLAFLTTRRIATLGVDCHSSPKSSICASTDRNLAVELHSLVIQSPYIKKVSGEVSSGMKASPPSLTDSNLKAPLSISSTGGKNSGVSSTLR